jgi:hypothetical protein
MGVSLTPSEYAGSWQSPSGISCHNELTLAAERDIIIDQASERRGTTPISGGGDAWMAHPTVLEYQRPRQVESDLLLQLDRDMEA